MARRPIDVLRFVGLSADPASPADGEIWYNTTDDVLRARINGATVDLGSGGPGGGAPASAQYLTLSADATLSAERTLAVSQGLTVTDGGPNNSATLGFVLENRTDTPPSPAIGQMWLRTDLL